MKQFIFLVVSVLCCSPVLAAPISSDTETSPNSRSYKAILHPTFNKEACCKCWNDLYHNGASVGQSYSIIFSVHVLTQTLSGKSAIHPAPATAIAHATGVEQTMQMPHTELPAPGPATWETGVIA